MNKKIHETVPAKSERMIRDHADWKQLKKAIKRVLLPGKDTAINADDIEDRIRSLVSFPVKKQRKNETVRKAITEMIEVDYEPIISCSKGYYIADRMEDFIEVRDRLMKLVKGTMRKVDAYERIMEEWSPPGQVKDSLFE